MVELLMGLCCMSDDTCGNGITICGEMAGIYLYLFDNMVLAAVFLSKIATDDHGLDKMAAVELSSRWLEAGVGGQKWSSKGMAASSTISPL